MSVHLLALNSMLYMSDKNNIKRYIISAVITFVAGFGAAILPHLDSITIDNISTGAVSGLVLIGVRAGIKLCTEAFISWYANRKNNTM